ncbi:putative hybrid NRPS/PKS enzyme [Biscogniauxia marginata]|nr:putative hybrid NRPS/PKS enzyme [Biscogniauxia marginata]
MAPSEPIAIIGTGCRFPGECSSPSRLWDLLREPRDLLKEIPESRFSVDPFYHPDNLHHGTSNVRHSYLLEEDLRLFDAQFFGIKPIEANSIDPQQRLLLETVYESLEAAGLSVNQLQGSDTATYVGVMSADFTDLIGRDTETFPMYFATGTARSILSNRLSYFFDWHGPSMTIDTACSSSLVALHQAVQTLRSGESSIAVVAGSNLILGPEQYIAESKLQMLSPTGRSRMWDADADGYARGEGVASVVLKRLDQALLDGDHIECVIRETGLNQDGKTPGITMPSASAQAALIRSTYAKAGLDLTHPADRPQYFEAHGTGTPAGDPVEAEAIRNAFFGSDLHYHPSSGDEKLYVGSIKTVVGHTEGTAGLAAVIKASLALQASTIPPNRLLNRINPKVAPFYDKLKILSKAQEWPQLASGGVRRASVNSFGFGGANAHAILENFDSTRHGRSTTLKPLSFTPFNFSASSRNALIANLRSYRDYLEKNTEINPRDLSWTLNNRRSALRSRVSVSAATIESLVAKIDETIESLNEQSSSIEPIQSESGFDKIRILGVFTGQGAQWARMGAELIENSPGTAEIIARLDQSLLSLPARDRPSWTLRDQLLASPEYSQVNTASVSQPLCTAVQIMLVDLLRTAGVEFAGVVGHSSGEIGAAYAAGCLTASDAIRIAYYRGLHLISVTKKGAMLAVGTSYEDAKELCDVGFEGRVCVAASNSPASVTLSGDADAIDEVKIVLDEEKKFNRLLKVDRAYHSHHMLDCVEPYVRSLRQCNIKATTPRAGCTWISSVFTQDISDVPASLSDQYWSANLAQPVRFTEALQLLVQETTSYDLAIEVGPHPALKGPATQTLQECMDEPLPYTGVLLRGNSDIEAFASALGFIWSQFGEGTVDFSAFDRFAHGVPNSPELLKDLPTYQWDHNREFWHESRVSKAFRTRKDLPNELLGRQVLDGAPNQLRWRNILSPKEIEWLDGHQVQGQIVFPCAGYVSAAIEATLRMCGSQPIQTIELEDFIVGNAVVFDNSDSGVEILITLTNIIHREDYMSAKFSFYSSPNGDTLDMTSHADCQIRVALGDSVPDLMSSKPDDDYAMAEVESDRFYNALGQLGFGYTGPFRALSGMKRKLGAASGFIDNTWYSSQIKPLLIQPATLDAAIQAIMLAYCYPGDSMLRSIYLPTGIKKLTVNPMHCLAFAGKKVVVPFDSAASIDTSKSLSGDVNIYSPDGSRAIQLEGLQTQPLSVPNESSDLNIFTELVWDVDRPDRVETLRRSGSYELNADLLFSLERVALFYLRSLDKTIPVGDRTGLEWHHQRLFAYVDHVLSKFARGVNPFAKKEWEFDSKDVILDIFNRYPDNIDLRLMRAVGENLPAVVRGQLTMLEPMIQDNMLNDFYVVAHGMPRYTQYLATMASQIGHRYPHMHVLEIGAGTGGATKSFLKELGDSFSSYTFTDISSGFFEKAAEVFASHSSRMTFKVLDIEKDIESQGFADSSFDLIIASLVLHATRNLAQTMRNVRRLLKPGGYLLLLEITENEQMRFGLIFGGLAGWWLGYDDGRAFSPCIGIDEWSTLLKETGFSGIETAMPHHDKLPVPLSIIVSQAVDDKVAFLKRPLQPSQWTTVIQRLTIVSGGQKSARIAVDIENLLKSRCGTIKTIDSLHNIGTDDLPVGGTVLCLSDIDEPVFKSMDTQKLQGFQEIFKQSQNVLWITQGSRSGDPFARMVVGFGRTLVLEMLHLRLQFLDIPTTEHPDLVAISEVLLQLEMAGSWDVDGSEEPLLHSIEPELYLENGRMFVPRIKLNKNQNNRYNSGRRLITEEVDLQEAVVEVVQHGSSVSLVESETPPPVAEPSKAVEIDVIHSVSRAIEVQPGVFLFPVFGVDRQTGEKVLGLSPVQASKATLPKSFILPQETSDDGEQTLQLFYTELLARSALRDAYVDSEVVVLQPSLCFARALKRVASDKGVNIVFLTTQLGTKWHYVHPKASRRDIKAFVPRTANYFLNMQGDTPVSTAIVDCLPPSAQVASQAMLTSPRGSLKDKIRPDIRKLLVDIKYALRYNDGVLETSDLPVVNLNELVSSSDQQGPRLVNWRSLPTAPVRVKPINSRVKFGSDKTYWLVGLTGGLGLSLCEWMSQQGARYIAISSRNPKVNERWLTKMKNLGVKVKVIANDISNRDSVQAVYREICREMPPIAGVAQGAMVLHDTMFIDLDIERLNKVLNPKVKGATYLEEIFKNTDLEFFVFFSSMAAVTGNPGQSAYAAANMFMSSLANQRRERGLNASAVHIGAIFGNGYVTRELTLAQQEFLRKVGNLWLSEHDFRTLFAEAIFAGQRVGSSSPELSTGLKILDSDQSESITWFNNPMFQHCIKSTQDIELVNEGSKSAAPVKTQLLDAVSPAEVFEIISEAFISKLRTSLQVEDDRPIIDLSADRLGIDSLVAVDIRSWFIKELQVEIPVLKILSGATVRELLVRAQELLPTALTPNLDPNSDAKPRPKKAQNQSKPQKTQKKLKEKAQPPAPKKSQKNIQDRVTPVPATTPAKETESEPSKSKVDEPKLPSTLAGITLDDQNASEMPIIVSSTPSSPPTFIDVDASTIPGASVRSTSSLTSWTEIDDLDSEKTPSDSPPSSKQTLTKPSNIQVQKRTPMAFAQSRFWFLNHYLQDTSTFNITVSVFLRGSLDICRFEHAVSVVGQRHEALRTRFAAKDTQDVYQEVLSTSTLSLECREISSETQVDEVYRELKDYAFKLEEGENMRIILLKRRSTSFQLLIAYNHINMDGVSLEVILRDLQSAYESEAMNPRILQYPDFSENQRQEFKSGQWNDDLAFWRKEFPHIPQALPLLPLAKVSTRSALTTYSTNITKFHIEPTVFENIKATCQKLRVAPFHFHLAVFFTLLTRLVDVEELCIGVSSANRFGAEMMQSVGMYLNLLPLLFKTQIAQTFTNALKMVREKVLGAFSHSRVPFDLIVNELNVPRSASHSPLFQVMVNYRPGISEKRKFCGCESQLVEFEQGQTPYDLSLDIIENPGGDCQVILAGQSVLYGPHEMNILKSAYSNLLSSFARNPALRLNNPQLYDADEVKKAIQLGRGPTYTYLWPETVIHRIDAMVHRYGHRTALADGQGRELTYTQMANRVNALATELSRIDIKHGSRVGIFMEPGVDWICSLLAVLRLDATYVPLDARNGLDRLSGIVQDCKPEALLIDTSSQQDTQSLGSFRHIINVDRTNVTVSLPQVSNAAKSDSVAVIMYTSGSTGVPKGIVMKHYSFRNNVESSTEKWYFREGQETTLQQSSYSFDMSLSQTFLTLSNGGTLHVVPRRFRGDPASISSIIKKQGITFTETTPSEYISWIRYGDIDNLRHSSWRIAVSGGEMVTNSLKTAFSEVGRSDLRLIDCYGPTEITFCSNSREVNYQEELSQELASVGLRTWPNYSVYIVDANMKPIPVGMPGEVLIGGAGVVAGYLHSELSSRGFRRDSFASPEYLEKGWDRIHRTGDFGRLDGDGSLILGGRKTGDTQVKLRGLRVDLREIESTIISTADGHVIDAAVTVHESETTGSEFLVAFVTVADTVGDDAELQKLLQQLPLPQYMRPSAIIRLSKLPTNSSNKLDRLALKNIPLPRDQQEIDSEISLNETESQLKQAWESIISQQVLSQHQIRPESDFFHVGGNSMLLVHLRSQIREQFGIDVSLFQLFDASTLGGMATLVEESRPTARNESIDWDSETEVHSSLLNIPVKKQFCHTPEVVVLTGATGFLGRAILSRLLTDDSVQKIHCLAVRRDDRELPSMFKSPKVIVHKGDLTLPRFGLAEKDILQIFSEAHAVIHNGADVSFMKSYRSLKPANLDATKELVRLSIPHGISFHYISTASVTHLTGQESFEQCSVSAYTPPLEDGYVATKWASERYLEKVSDQCELPIWIHRPSSITGDGAPKLDLMTNLLHYSRTLRAIPDTKLWRGWLDFVSVDAVAMQIADEVYEDYSWPGNVKYLYESGDHEISLSDLKGVLEREIGSRFEKVSLDEWVSRAQEYGLHPLLGEYLRGVSDTPIVFPRLVKEGSFF